MNVSAGKGCGCSRISLPRFSLLAGLLLAAGAHAAAQEPAFEVETAELAEVLGLQAGMTVADVGAGEGRYSAFLADRVGPSGRVYATEITADQVAGLRRALEGRPQAEVLLGRVDGTALPAGCCDRILLRRVFHHFQEPRAMLDSLLASLRPGGLIAIVDFLPRHDLGNPDGTPDDHEHGTTVDHLIEQVTARGFELVRRVEDWPSRMDHGRATDYCVVFRRPD